eukprot:scaffold209732_cov39-Tisochrysis_lutea.AAC.1
MSTRPDGQAQSPEPRGSAAPPRPAPRRRRQARLARSVAGRTARPPHRRAVQGIARGPPRPAESPAGSGANVGAERARRPANRVRQQKRSAPGRRAQSIIKGARGGRERGGRAAGGKAREGKGEREGERGGGPDSAEQPTIAGEGRFCFRSAIAPAGAALDGNRSGPGHLPQRSTRQLVPLNFSVNARSSARSLMSHQIRSEISRILTFYILTVGGFLVCRSTSDKQQEDRRIGMIGIGGRLP